jgi:hypothetical protein
MAVRDRFCTLGAIEDAVYATIHGEFAPESLLVLLRL